MGKLKILLVFLVTNQRARSVKTKIEPMYFYVKNAELIKLGFVFSVTLCSSLAVFLENGLNFRLTLKTADKKVLNYSALSSFVICYMPELYLK